MPASSSLVKLGTANQLSCSSCGPRWDSLLEGGDPVATSAPAVEVVDVEEAKGQGGDGLFGIPLDYENPVLYIYIYMIYIERRRLRRITIRRAQAVVLRPKNQREHTPYFPFICMIWYDLIWFAWVNSVNPSLHHPSILVDGRSSGEAKGAKTVEAWAGALDCRKVHLLGGLVYGWHTIHSNTFNTWLLHACFKTL